MSKDIYKWWSKKALKNEILKLKLTYNELFDAMLKTQEENRELQKAIKIIDDANVNLRADIKDLRKQLNDRSYVRVEEQITELKDQLTKAKEIIDVFLDFESSCMERGIYISDKIRAEAEQFLKETEKFLKENEGALKK